MATLIKPGLDRLISALLQQTRVGEIRWRKVDDDMFVYDGRSGSIVVRTGDRFGQVYRLRVLTPDAETADFVEDDGSESDLAALFQAIRNAHYGAATPVVDALIEEISPHR